MPKEALKPRLLITSTKNSRYVSEAFLDCPDLAHPLVEYHQGMSLDTTKRKKNCLPGAKEYSLPKLLRHKIMRCDKILLAFVFCNNLLHTTR